MKITKPNSINYEQKRTKHEKIRTLDRGITKKLLEKYKPKGLLNIETIINRDSHRGVV
tara:strand:+ start:439 stop:612 length:174 start_codon:yes stop_codon:yes gene_type:complete